MNFEDMERSREEELRKKAEEEKKRQYDENRRSFREAKRRSVVEQVRETLLMGEMNALRFMVMVRIRMKRRSPQRGRL